MEVKYGWNLGESGWNGGMDDNLLKLSLLLNGFVDQVVSTLPPPVEGKSYFNTTDNHLYYVVQGAYAISPSPKNFTFKEGSTDKTYTFNGTSLTEVSDLTSLTPRVDALETAVSSLGSAAFQDESVFVKQADLLDPASNKNAYLIVWGKRRLSDRLSDEANPKDFGAIADGQSHPLSDRYATLAAAQVDYPFATSLSDQIDWAACQASLNLNTTKWYIPDGHYILNKNLTRLTSINIVQDGLLDFSIGVGYLDIRGSITQIQDLSTNITKQARTLTFGTAPSLSAGDVFIIYNPTDFSWSPHRSYYRAGEFFRAHSISGNSVRIYGYPSDNYLASDLDVYRMSPLHVSWDNPNLIASSAGTSSPAAKITLATSVQLGGMRSTGGVYAGIELERCYDMTITGGSLINNSPANGDDYGLLISNCQKWTVLGGGHQATRHAITLGGSSGPGCVPCRDFSIIGCVLETSGDDVGAADFHGNCDNGRYIDCVIDSHASIGGRDSSYIDCKITPRSLADGSAVFGSEIVGGSYKFINCEMTTYGDLNSFGLINLTCGALLKSDLKVIVRNLHVTGSGGGTSAKLIRVSPFTGETLKINTDVRGVRNELSQTLCVSWVRNDYDSTQLVVSDGHIVDDVYGPSGMYLLYPTGAGLTGIPRREMRQSGSVTITTTATTSITAATQTFRYPYSKVPTYVNSGISGVAGAVLDTLGGQIPITRIRQHTTTTIIPAVSATAAFTAGATASLQWEAEIKEV